MENETVSNNVFAPLIQLLLNTSIHDNDEQRALRQSVIDMLDEAAFNIEHGVSISFFDMAKIQILVALFATYMAWNSSIIDT